ncbi:MAG TPA: dienelactone hydrolase family protein [Candidatus Binataceae bacterium]|nr:dienelactone hydrolase family protein [Candidatus Binataceae bacterium]
MALAGEVTDLSSLETRDVTFDSDNFKMEAYLARPKAPGTYPGVLILHEAFGLVEHERDVARRFANQGFIALAPNVYSRVGALKNATDMAEVRAKMFGIRDAQLVRDFEAAAGFIRAQPGANGKVGCVGFCVGGRWTLLFACSSDKVNAAVDCWGGFITRATPESATTPERPAPVIDLVQHLHCPLYVVCGEEDQNPSPADAEELRKRLQQAGKTFQIEVFKNAGHAFFADYRPSYREKAAFELWPKMVGFFKTHLK